MLTFWIIAIALTAIGCMAVLLPFARSKPADVEGTAFDIEVYRDQLDEIDADSARGLIAPAEAAEARAEIGRRILKTHDQTGGGKRQSAIAGKWLATAALVLIPLASWGVYSVTGSPHLPGQPLQARLDKNPAESTIEELIARAESHLANNPEDGRGWDVIAPIYVRVKRYEDAVNAYQHALRLGGNDARRQSGLGEALTASAGGVVGPEARRAFEAARSLEPGNAKARFFLAMANAQAGNVTDAVAGWQSLVGDVSPQSPWRLASLNAIKAIENQTEDVEKSRQSGPDAEDIAAAEQMSAEDRSAMIESMVAGLAARLQENPLDREGWQRLVRSYVVLGKADEARATLQKGREALAGSPGAAELLVEFAAGLGIVETD